MSKSHNPKRHGFPPDVIQTTKMRAAFICSNPDCRLMTVGPSIKDDKFLYNGQVAHILPASLGGPRDAHGIAPEQRVHLDNAIFLCGSCAQLIDKNNGIDYPADLLIDWKRQHMLFISNALNKQKASLSKIPLVNINEGTVIGNQNIYYGAMETKDKADEHDIEIFNRLENVATEGQIMEVFLMLKTRHRILSSHQDILDAVKNFLLTTANTFLDEGISISAKNLIKELEDLIHILCYDFDTYPYDQRREDYYIELIPQVAHWTGRPPSADEKESYRIISEKLMTLDTTAIYAYQQFRIAVKKKLYL